MEPWIQTFSGKAFNPLEPDPAMICIEDIAHALSLVNRFTGHTEGPRSVAVHSIDGSELIATRGGDAFAQLAGLLHDASEAYLNDIAAPVKQSDAFFKYREAEGRLQRIIVHQLVNGRFFTLSEHEAVKKADLDMLIAERWAFMPPGGPWQPPQAPLDAQRVLSRHGSDWAMTRAMFLARYRELTFRRLYEAEQH